VCHVYASSIAPPPGWRCVLNLVDDLGAAYWTLVHLRARVHRVTIGTGTGGRTPWRKDRLGAL